jgi:ABC transporter substrate binding protein (PQQ-dependent alcohol dehydrogenase system)
MISAKALFVSATMLLCVVGTALGQQQVKIGYLGREDDPRYDPDVVYARIEVAPGGNPVEGAILGIEDLKIISEASGRAFALDHQQASELAGLTVKLNEMVKGGESFVILDLPAPLLDQLAAFARDLPVTLVNATAPEDFLRNRCYPNLLHTAASDRMHADAIAQYLRTRNWTRVLVLVGEQLRDKAIAEAFQGAADRLRLDVVDTRSFTLATDPASREANNTLLITGGADYDVIYVADSHGEFARYLPYATQLPRPVLGSTGLISSEWQWSSERYGAPQVTSRFADLASGRRMAGSDWSTWMAAKAIVTAYAKARSDDPAKIAEYMRSSRFKLDGSKGVQLGFRSWDGQMRMPLMLATHNAVIAQAPLEGFAHQINDLDTLGTDEPEHQCE